MFRRPINQSVRWSMKKALKGERLIKFRTGPTSKVIPTKMADAIKYKTKISSTFSHLIENAKGSLLGSKLGKITPYQWVTGLPRCAFVTEIYINNGIYKTVYGPEMKRSDTYEYDQWRWLNREYVEHFLRSQLSNAKVVQELYNSEGRKNVKDYIFILDSKGLLTDDVKEKIKDFIKSPTTKKIATSVFVGLINYTVCPGIGTVIKFVLTNGDVVETVTGEDSVAFICIVFCIRSWPEQFHAKGTNNSSMDDKFIRVMKRFAKGVAYRLGADAVKDGAKKLHERYKSTKSQNEKDNEEAELKKENVSQHDGDGPCMVNDEDESEDNAIDEEFTIIFIPSETTDDNDLFIKATEEFAKGIAYKLGADE